MCGRYVIEGYQELSERLVQVPLRYDFAFKPNWNAAPTQTLPVVVEDGDDWVVRGMHWGIVPRWTKPGQRPKVMPINARSETAAEKPMFRHLMRERRCIVPANGFYEWQRRADGKQPFYIHPDDHDLMLFGGLWEEADAGPDGETVTSFAILTTDANTTMTAVHDRMPMILRDDDIEQWLARDETDVAALEHLLVPAEDGDIAMHPVSTAVNAVRNNTPELIEPLGDDADTEDEG